MKDFDPERMQELFLLGSRLSEIKDFDILMENILSSARKIVNCDAGSIYVKHDDILHFEYTQNDTLSSRLEPGEKLIYNTFKLPVNTSSISGYVASTGKFLNIEDVYSLPKHFPFHHDSHFDQTADYHTKSMLVFPLKTSSGNILGVLQLINARNGNGDTVGFDAALEPYVEFFVNHAATAFEKAHLTRAVLLRMISMAELHDPAETGAHVNRVAGFSVEIYETWAKAKRIPDEELEKNRDILRMAAMLHDVGKVAITDLILKKKGKLDPEEYAVMKRHTILGAKLFSSTNSEFEEAARDVVMTHHERYDGKGYPGWVDPYTGEPIERKTSPDGEPLAKSGEEIPLFGRIVAVADVYDALSSSRSYKEPWEESKILNLLREESGKQFDSEIIKAFFTCYPSILSIKRRYRES